jgi:putative ABC transport system permease protein
MEQFFGVPVARLGVELGLVLAALIGVLVFWGARGAPLLKLGVRNLPRRPVRALLIVFGLTLSTTVISAAFGTGDSISSTLRSLVVQPLGTTDEPIVINPPRQSTGNQARALANGTFGGLKADDLGFFPLTYYQRIQDVARDSDQIAAILPAISDQVTVVLGDAQQTRTAVGLLATHSPDAAFGTLRGSDGTPISLEELAPDEVVLNAEAAAELGLSAGQTIQIVVYEGQEPWPVRIAAISETGGIGGTAPLILANLEIYQQQLGRLAQVNQILVVNRGGQASVERSGAASSELRAALADRAAAQSLKDYLARPESQRGLVEAEAQLQGRDRANVAALREEALRPDLTDRFVSLATDPRVRRQLYFVASQIPNRGQRNSIQGTIRSLTVLSVVEVKREGLDQADEYGNVVTTVFLVLGIFSLGAAVLLIHLIFALLAADRSAELATLRSLGMGRRQIAGIFLVEGIIYALLGAGLGALAGIFATRLTVASLSQALASFGYALEPRVEPRSIAVAFAAGALLTFAAMCLSAWRVSHTAIVSATRGEAETEGRNGGFVAGAALLAAGAWAWWRWREPALSYLPRHPLVAPGALSLVLLGIACFGGAALGKLRTARAERARGALSPLLGLLIALVWLRALAALPTLRGDTRSDALAAAVGGLALIVTSVWTATRALGPGLRGLDWLLWPLARLRLIVRPAAGYLGSGRWRTGLTVTMFGMVVFIMVAALTMIETLVDAYAGSEPPVAGFDLRADMPNAATASHLSDLPGELSRQQAIGRAAFGAIGGTTPIDARAIQLGIPRSIWQNARIVAADDGFLSGSAVGFERRAKGFNSDAAVWAALRDRPGLAVVTGSTASSFLTPPDGNGDFAPFTVWVRPAEEGTPVKLTVIGIVDPRSELDAGIWTSRTTAEGLGVDLAPPTSYFLALAPGTSAKDAVEGLQVAFADRSLTVTDMSSTIRIGQSIRALLTQLVQGFMGLGLVAGVAALGILGIQSVIERRQQLGTLRAIGYTRGETRSTLAFESAVTAALGISLGTALGLILARSLVALLAVRNPEIRYAIPWDQIAITLSLAWLGTVAALAVAAWQAGRVSPADALRA